LNSDLEGRCVVLEEKNVKDVQQLSKLEEKLAHLNEVETELSSARLRIDELHRHLNGCEETLVKERQEHDAAIQALESMMMDEKAKSEATSNAHERMMAVIWVQIG
jgi:vacuolar-type H+-ATPase subunit I/STV1